ncbi:hypothetical protein ACLIA0_01885 [Bacillaceae bacterium W0354]
MFWEEFKLILQLNIINIILFLILISLAYALLKPLVKRWIANNCITTLTYFFSTSAICTIIFIYTSVIDNESVVIKNILISLWVAFISIGLFLMFKFIAKSLTQLIKNKNTI